MRVGINGMGRIGRLALRAALGRHGTTARRSARRQSARCRACQRGQGRCGVTAHLLEFDSIHGRWRQNFAADGEDAILIGNRRIGFSAASLPGEVPWGDLGCDIVLECTGKFLKPDQLQGYFDRGVRRVIVAAPVKDAAALNVVVGVNDDRYDPREHRLLTAASCTTNCLAPVVKVVHEALGIRHGQITTIHDPTNTNVVVDAPHKDLRRARSAMLSLQPTTTGSATAIALIYPELKGRLNGHAVRAPVLNASLTDCVFELQRPTTAAEVNNLFRAAAAGPLAGILGFEARPLVSADYCNDTRSAIVDGPSTMVTDGRCSRSMPGTTTRLAMPAAWSISPTSSSSEVRDGRRSQLPDRHGQLLELHADRRRAAHAGAAALLCARLHAVHAGVPVPAL